MSALLARTCCGTEEEARAIARAVVQARLAACAPVDRIASVYRRRGRVEEADERRVWLKTSEAARDRLAALVTGRHSYDEPALIAVPIAAGAPSYLARIAENAGG